MSDNRLATARGLLDHDPEEAEKLCDQLLIENIEVENATLCKGVAILKSGRPAEAGQYFKNCGIEAAEIYVNAASSFQKAGQETQEISALTKLLDFAEAKYENSFKRLAEWAFKNESWATARKAFLALFNINSDDFTYTYRLAQSCLNLKQHKEALTYFLKSMELLEDENEIAAVHSSIAGIYKDLGMQGAAYRHFKIVYEKAVAPSSASNLIMHMQYMHGVSLKEFYEQCKEYSARFLRIKKEYCHSFDRLDPNKAQEGLRIGFVSGDFVAHSLTNLMLEPFRKLKEVAPQHTLICYSSREEDKENDWTEKYRESVDLWRNIHPLSNEEAAKLIKEDQVDVLVELAGHTAYNRLPIFGHKPAPVQVGWISGMMTPPAISTINYFLTDKWMEPPSAAEVCQEKLFYLPAAYTYFPMAPTPPVVEMLPADRKGHITFGSLNNPCKISRPVLQLWASVVKEVPNSRLAIKVFGKDHERSINKMLAEFGVPPQRVSFIGYFDSSSDVMQYYTDEIDMVLDTFPCSGCLTSAEAMWMGVPVMTLSGDTFLHRQTWTLIHQVGLADELGAETEEQFVKRASELAKNRTRLREIRNMLRDKMKQAPMRDPTAIAYGIMQGLEFSWKDWCDSRQPLKQLAIEGV